MTWQPSFGATVHSNGTLFRVWAPERDSIDVVTDPGGFDDEAYSLQKTEDGFFEGMLSQMTAGVSYKYRVDGGDDFPDPASRFQPEGVHGVSEVVDAAAYRWHDGSWGNIPFENLIIYELHVGAFTPEGTFAALVDKLEYLKDLGITAVELMPVADFPGKWNWGYDGVQLFAPARCYGTPDDLRWLVDRAHQIGLAVILDVVYNHLGPDGNYLGVYSPYFHSSKNESPWGEALNFDEEHCDVVRDFFIDNALYWLHDFHIDGLRLDATHAIQDDSGEHFLAELTTRVRQSFPDRIIHLIAEDHRNLAHMVQPVDKGGWGLDAVWADDFHHQTRRLLAGDDEGYFRDFSGTADDLAKTVEQGWFFTGQHSQHLGKARGSDPAALSPRSLVTCLQNHDQIGNRALGQRLHHQIDLAAWRAATALWLCTPQTPLLFMGQEWAATTPFLYFTNHHDDLGRSVTEGRRQEFRHFSAFSDSDKRTRIPDPQAQATFEVCRLNWLEPDREPHTGIQLLYRELLYLRHEDPALSATSRDGVMCQALDDDTIVLLRRNPGSAALLVICRLRGAGEIRFTGDQWGLTNPRRWELVMTTEDAAFTSTSQTPDIMRTKTACGIYFVCPAAVIFRVGESK